MTDLLIRDLPPDVHVWLKQEAKQHRRSMTQLAIVVFRECMHKFRPVHFPPPVKTRTPLTDDFITKAKKEGRP